MIGIDNKIDALKTVLQSDLITVANNTYIAYGRAYINTKTLDEAVPQVLIAGSKEYQTVRFDDTKDGISFMIVENPVTPIGEETYVDMAGNVAIYFAVNLSKFYSSVTERAVEYFHRDVLELLADSEFKFLSYVQGLEAFAEFTSVKPTDDMQPFYLVKFNTSVEFQINENYNC